MNRDLFYEFRGKDLAQVLWAYYKSKNFDEIFFRKASKAILERNIFREFNPQDISNILFSFSKSNFVDSQLFTAILKYLLENKVMERQDFNAKDFKGIFLSLLKSIPKSVMDPDFILYFFKISSNIIINRRILNEVTPTELSKFLHIFSSIFTEANDIFPEIEKIIIFNDMFLKSFSSFEISSVLYSFSKSKDRKFNPLIFSKAFEALKIRRLITEEFSAVDINRLIFSMVSSSVHDRMLYQECFEAMNVLIDNHRERPGDNVTFAGGINFWELKNLIPKEYL